MDHEIRVGNLYKVGYTLFIVTKITLEGVHAACISGDWNNLVVINDIPHHVGRAYTFLGNITDIVRKHYGEK